MSVVELGGPRMAEGSGAHAACSASRVRRWLAGELIGDDAALAEAHLAACPRCQAVRGEVERERAELATAVPFEAFAASVAEKLASAEPQPARPPFLSRWRRTVPGRLMNVAASLLFVGLIGVLFASGMQRGEGRDGREPSQGPRSPEDPRGVRTKGGAGLSVFALRAARSFALREGERSQPGDRLLPALEPGGHSNVLVLLVEPGEASVLYRGPALAGPLPEAFEWTGSAREARVVAVYADAPVEVESVVAAVKEGRMAGGRGVEVVERRIQR